MRRWLIVSIVIGLASAAIGSRAAPPPDQPPWSIPGLLALIQKGVDQILTDLDSLIDRVDALEANVDEILTILNAAFHPDLVPVAPVCVSLTQDGLVAHIRNQGLAVAGPSVVSVKWGGQGTTTADVPAIGVNETVDVVVPESATSCFQVDCTLTVTVDSADDLSEDDESNNVLSELCIG